MSLKTKREETDSILKKVILEMLTEFGTSPLISRYYETLEEESSDEDNEPIVEDFILNEVAYFSAGTFQSNFSINKEIVYKLIEQYEQSGMLRHGDAGRKKISAEKTVLMALWYLVKTETFRELSTRFKVSYSSAYRTLKRVMEFLISMAPDIIKWPHNEDYPAIAAEFNDIQGINNVIGIIDACHVKIERPKDEESYLNNKGFYSLKVQAICTTNYLFTDIHCGQPGSFSDATILRSSSIFFKFLNPDFYGNYFILGDEAYPSYDWLVPAYKFSDDLTEEQQMLNLKLTSTRSPSDVTFSLLKGRFKRLTHLHNLNITTAAEMIMGACILHNICILNEDDTEIEIFDISDDLFNTVSEKDLDDDDEDDEEEEDVKIVPNKRDALYNELFINKCIVID